jgi:hypothetical protein
MLFWLGLAAAHRLTRAPPGRWTTAAVAALFACSALGSIVMYATYLDAPYGPAYPVADPVRTIYWSIHRHLLP